MDVKAALLRTADWLEANPERHTTVVLATTGGGDEVDPFSPQAHCFCAYGRFLVELGDEGQRLFERNPRDRYGDIQRATGIRYDDVYIVNDATVGESDRGNPAVIPFLRNKAK